MSRCVSCGTHLWGEHNLNLIRHVLHRACRISPADWHRTHSHVHEWNAFTYPWVEHNSNLMPCLIQNTFHVIFYAEHIHFFPQTCVQHIHVSLRLALSPSDLRRTHFMSDTEHIPCPPQTCLEHIHVSLTLTSNTFHISFHVLHTAYFMSPLDLCRTNSWVENFSCPNLYHILKQISCLVSCLIQNTFHVTPRLM